MYINQPLVTQCQSTYIPEKAPDACEEWCYMYRRVWLISTCDHISPSVVWKYASTYYIDGMRLIEDVILTPTTDCSPIVFVDVKLASSFLIQ